MFNKNLWKQPIYKDDLKYVLINGLIYTILVGILCGGIDYVFNMINFPISISLFAIAYFVGNKVRKSYYTYHILYPVLALVFMVLGLTASAVSTGICLSIESGLPIGVFLGNPFLYFQYILSPIYYIYSMIVSFDFMYLLYTILEFVIYIWAFLICFRLAKGRN